MRTRKNKSSQNMTRKNKRIYISVPKNTIPKVSDLLWLNRQPSTLKITLNDKTTTLNLALTAIMTRLGADTDLLQTHCFAICGPTAVGKTKFINALKDKYNIETINMDTMQVYSGISWGTGRTNLATTKGSYIYGVYDPNKEFHIIDYLIDVFKAMRTINANGNIPLFEGASKSMLAVLYRIFPNLKIFGIRAVSDSNIVEKITKRISLDLIKNATIELAKEIQLKRINPNSTVLRDNYMVYNIILTHFSRKELMDKNIKERLNTDLSEKANEVTRKAVKENIRLHHIQLHNLQKFKNIIWFTNDEESIEKMEKKFLEIKNSYDK
jgi:tRNA A37 N6-isopentenylltransferase MiaA